MTYEGMYKVAQYFDENNIEFTQELREIIKSLNKISDDEYDVFDYSFNVVKWYFYHCRNKFVIEFLRYVKKQEITEEDVLYCMTLISSQDTPQKQEQVAWACEDEGIRNDKEALHFIVIQSTWESMREVRFASLDKNIRKDEIAYLLIVIQDDWEKQSELIETCKIDDIRNDKKLLYIIVSRPTLNMRIQARFACQSNSIRNDINLLNLIIKQSTWEGMREMRLACSNEDIRNNEELLYKIANLQDWHEQCELRMQYESKDDFNKKVESIQENLDNSLGDAKLFIETYENLDPNIQQILSKKRI